MPGRILIDSRVFALCRARPKDDASCPRDLMGSDVNEMTRAAKETVRLVRVFMRRRSPPFVIDDGAYDLCVDGDAVPGEGRGGDDKRRSLQEEEQREDADKKSTPC